MSEAAYRYGLGDRVRCGAGGLEGEIVRRYTVPSGDRWYRVARISRGDRRLPGEMLVREDVIEVVV